MIRTLNYRPRVTGSNTISIPIHPLLLSGYVLCLGYQKREREREREREGERERERESSRDAGMCMLKQQNPQENSLQGSRKIMSSANFSSRTIK